MKQLAGYARAAALLAALAGLLVLAAGAQEPTCTPVTPGQPVCLTAKDCDGLQPAINCVGEWACVEATCQWQCQGADSCTTNADCAGATDPATGLGLGLGEYCAKDAGDCEGKGACTARPEMCPMVYAPVCGCDGHTYGNSCVAAGSGVNVAHGGECEPVPNACTTHAECEALDPTMGPISKLYCAKKPGDCGAWGVCEQKPTACYKIWAPVCGCDGTTYDNDCFAYSAGVNVAHTGACQPQPAACASNADCDAGIDPATGVPSTMYCAKATGDCDGEGTCQARPGACYDLWAPVCGCDGTTYANDCDAAAAGASLAHEGACEPQPQACKGQTDCDALTDPVPGTPATLYCAKNPGVCDGGEGTCQTRPTMCPLVWAPVCGCDGLSYGNTCEAAAAGVNVAEIGECPHVWCWGNADCKAGFYCAFDGCAAETGECKAKPTICPDVWAPVCGCDGITYGNYCEAAAGGATIDHEGACKVDPEGCKSNADCATASGAMTHFCLKAVGDCQGTGACMAKPEACTLQYDPVCGCDGKTHGNACSAWSAGTSVSYAGTCL